VLCSLTVLSSVAETQTDLARPGSWRQLLLSEVLPEVDTAGGWSLPGSAFVTVENSSGAEVHYYYNARWYDPTLGRFITEDPARDQNNWYAYVKNNPLRYIDPTGLLTAGDFYSLLESANPTAQNLLGSSYSELVNGKSGVTEAFTEKMNSEFSDKLRSLVGTPYSETPEVSRAGSDCSGNEFLALREMGFSTVPRRTANEMGKGQADYVTLHNGVDEGARGTAGMLNFYDQNGDGKIEHMNAGVGMKYRSEGRDQVVDASDKSTNWDRRNSSPNQQPKGVPGQTNITWSPYPANESPVAQGEINWLTVITKYSGEPRSDSK
jgi:RHS repeat-associated protein